MSSALRDQSHNLDTLQVAVIDAERRNWRRTILVVAFLSFSALLSVWTVVTFVAPETGIGGNVNIGLSKEQIEIIEVLLAERLGQKDAQVAVLTKEQIEQIHMLLTELRGPKEAQIAALTKLLVEKNPAAGPDARQAIGAAVGLIFKGAAEGDARSQQALDLLKANKIADATRLLNAVAGVKTTRAEQEPARAEQETVRAEKDRKEAAAAYRNLGAIASLRDPKKALEAYAKAVELDPDDGNPSIGMAGSIYKLAISQ
jgi:tetratricopeptide (TPR) repeat protein